MSQAYCVFNNINPCIQVTRIPAGLHLLRQKKHVFDRGDWSWCITERKTMRYKVKPVILF